MKTTTSEPAGKPNPFMAEAKGFNLERLVNIWKVGFVRAKNKKLLDDDILRFKAVCSMLTFRYGVSLPKVGK